MRRGSVETALALLGETVSSFVSGGSGGFAVGSVGLNQ